jgi:hypothetical protein
MSRDRHGNLTDGVYSVNDIKNRPHAYETRQEGKSYFHEGTDLGMLGLHAAAIADRDNLWRSDIPGEFARKAKVRFDQPVGIHQRTGQPTHTVNVMRRKTGTIHISPGSADHD